ncbi:hypothetical protein M8J76_009211 [Diaphorina citri]|nr:hypothetical protein M8J76_009211 [Diaphorina citri]
MNNLLNPQWSDSEEDGPQEEGLRHQVFRARVNFNAANDFIFVERFRVSRDVVEQILTTVSPFLEHPTNRRHALTSRQQVLLTLHWLGNGAQYHITADAHGVSKSTVQRTVHKVVECVVRYQFPQSIRFPENMAAIVEKFSEIAGMPCVIGAIDGTLINIDAPTENEGQFVDRHGKHSLNCMVVCGPQREFFYVSARWPGSLHDARVLRNSSLWGDMEEGWRPFPNGIILGDSAYPRKSWLMTPVNQNPNRIDVRRFNQAHKSTRSVVENSFGILKEKFPCLNYLRLNPTFAAEVFKACTTFCNMSKELEEDLPQEPVILEDEQQEPEADAPPPDLNAEERLQQLLRLFAR